MSKPAFVLDGYPSGASSTADVWSRQPPPRVHEFDKEVLGKLVEAEAHPERGLHVVVVIIAHSDRQDDAKRFPTPEARRQNEFDVSQQRAADARAWLFEQFAEEVLAAKGVVPADWDSAVRVSAGIFPVGASTLVNPKPVTEAQRQKNRRIEFFVVSLPRFK